MRANGPQGAAELMAKIAEANAGVGGGPGLDGPATRGKGAACAARHSRSLGRRAIRRLTTLSEHARYRAEKAVAEDDRGRQGQFAGMNAN